MSPLVLQFAIMALQSLPYIVQAGGDLVTQVNKIQTDLQAMQSQNRDPTAEEWAAQHSALLAALAAVVAPKPAS
jgi:hypothetical protein